MKESHEALDLGLAIADALKAAKADGQINWMDLPKFAPAIAKAKAAIEGGEKIDDELKAATTDELAAFAQRSIEVALALVDAIISK